MRRMLAFEDVLAIAARSDATRGIVLVGGQALNFWSDYFEIVTPATEDKFGVALSNDMARGKRPRSLPVSAARYESRARPMRILRTRRS